MQLWTDYEGVTIDGAFSLQKLLSPEGRSAFFSTAGPNGEPMVVRLIECHFDEEEILARWRCVEALSHPNFLKFEHYGQTELDGRPVVYAVFEKVDANLAGVLDEGHLTVKDVTQLACSLTAALDVMHTHGFVHEHIEPRNIFAVGEVVKLRSDCIREAPEGEEGRIAKRRDVHDLAMVILQALTQQASVEGIPDFALPPPFGEIIRNGLDGTWELEQIKTAVGGLCGAEQSAPLKSDRAVAKPVDAAPAMPLETEQKTPSVAKPTPHLEEQLSLPLLNEDEGGATVTRNRRWDREDALGQDELFSLRWRWLGAAGIFALILLLSAWALGHAWNARLHKAALTADTASQQGPQPAGPTSPRTVPNPHAANSLRAGAPASAGKGAGWRVIAFTYNRKTDAEKKVASLARSHPELRPAVFTVSGHAPYLVSVGGIMDRESAYGLAHRSGSLGLPHDTYAQNYSH